MILIGYLVWIGVVVFFCYRLALGGKQSSRAKGIFCTVLASVLILLPYWDVILGIPTMRNLCSQEAGVRKSEDIKFPLSSVMLVSDRPRSLCFSCFLILAKGLALETHADITLTSSPERSGLIGQSGHAVYWLAQAGDPACAAFENEYSSESSRYGLWRMAGAVYDGKACIASDRVEQSTAAFTLTYPTTIVSHRGVTVIRSRRAELRRRGQSRPIATLTHFMQLPWNGRIFSLKAGLPPAPSCPSFVAPTTWDNFAPEHLLELLSGQRQQEEVFK